MSTTWMTKYGARRVRVEPPSLDEALDAAAGLTFDASEQIRIAADLMQLPVDEVRIRAQRLEWRPGPTMAPRAAQPRRPVVVERRSRRTIRASN